MERQLVARAIKTPQRRFSSTNSLGRQPWQRRVAAWSRHCFDHHGYLSTLRGVNGSTINVATPLARRWSITLFSSARSPEWCSPPQLTM